MLTLNDGRSELWQWDTNRKLTVDTECSQVHFSNKVFGRSIDVDVVDGIAVIPDILLQTDKDLNAWAFVGTAENGYTKISKIFKVNKRNKPADYVFTPTEQTTLGEILDRIEDLENRPSGDVSEEDIQNAVNDYLDKNPISVAEKDPTVPAWAKKPNKPTYTAAEVGALPADTVIPEGGIPIPTTASVGQTIVVKAVDDDGKPTEWEAADLPSGGNVDLTGVVKSVNGQTPDENGNVQIAVSGGSGGGGLGYDVKRIGQKIINGDFSRIVLLGDSITDGYGGTDYNGSRSSAKSTNTAGYCWANMFKKYIAERYGIPVENYGYYGTNANYQHNQILSELLSTDLVIWLSGTNNRVSSGDFANYNSNIATYVQTIKGKVSALVFMPCVPATSADESTRHRTTQDINESAFKYVYGSTYYIDMYSKYIKYCEDAELTLSDTMLDGLHPNNIGYLHMFLILCRELGLPLNFYTDFSYSGDWWRGTALLVDTGMNLSGEAFLSWTDGIVPVLQLAQYNATEGTTLFSGKTLKEIRVGGAGFSVGSLTIGTVAVNTIGSSCIVENQITATVPANGVIVFENGFTIPANHTLAMGRAGDTARLSYINGGEGGTSENKQWVSSDNYMCTKSGWVANNSDVSNPTIALVAAFYV